MAAYDSSISPRPQVRFDNRGYYNRRSGLNLSHIKFDLLKISEMYDGILTEQLAMLPVQMYEKYLKDLIKDEMIYSYRVEAPELRTHHESGSKSFTYTFHIQGTQDRTAKVLKIHVGLYKSPWPFN